MRDRFRLLSLALMVTPIFAAASTVTGEMMDVDFIDDMRLSVRASNGKPHVIDAYCDPINVRVNGCKREWFVEDKDSVSHLRKSMLGKTVTLRYAAEQSGEGAGRAVGR